jgi:iron complex outermembrane receptor protein
MAERRDTADIDYQQSATLARRHQVTFGAGYRVTTGRVTAVAPTGFSPATRTDQLVSLFGQDDVALVEDRLRASLGIKLEHNGYTGVEAQPSARLVWTPHRQHTLVASVTRAVRTPSRVETDYTTTSLASAAVPLFVRLLPNPGFRSEAIEAYEVGYRIRPGSRAYFTVAGFYNHLDDVLSTELVGGALTEGGGSEPPRAVLPVMFRNGIGGESHGGELTADVRPLDRLRATLNYSYLKVAVSRDPDARDVSQEARYEGITPRHQLQAQAALDLPWRLATDVTVRRASRLSSGPVPAYTTASVRIGWRATPRLELAIVGQDLTHARHLEWPGGLPVRRSGYVKVTFRDRP